MKDKNPGLTLRVLLIAFLIIPINCYFQLHMGLVHDTFPTWIVPLSNVIFILIVVMVVNYLIRWFSPRMALRQGELFVLYMMLNITTTLSAGNILQMLVPVLGHAFWFATPENEFSELFLRYLPRWLTVSDKQALQGYYEGNSSFYLTENLKVWAPVILGWLLIFLVLAFIFLCLNTILRRQWTEHEKLTYPIVRLPLEMTNPNSGFFRKKLMWIGFAIAAGISLINGLSFLYPQIPRIPVKRRHYMITEGPLRYFCDCEGLRISFYPFAIGLMFLMPLSVLFSTALFSVLHRNALALGKDMGWTGFPYHHAQAFGAYLGFLILLFWVGRKYFADVIKNAFGREVDLDDGEEPIPYRVAVWGLWAGLILFAFLLHKGGMALWLAGIFAFLFLIVPIITTRIRAEAGLFTNFGRWSSPRSLLTTWLGTRRLGAQNLTALTVFFFNWEYHAQQMPQQLEGFKISEQANLSHRRMLVAIAIATVVGVLVSFWIQLHLYYKFGADSGYFRHSVDYGRVFFRQLKHWIYYPTNTDRTAVIFMGVGFSVMVLLSYLRVRFFWLPLHPLGYIIADRGEIREFIVPLFICMVAKWLILKYGGIRSYRRYVPFFLGLVLGDFLMGSIWSLLSIVLNMDMYQFCP